MEKVIIQYCSDLHLEFSENRNFLKHNPIKVVGEILLLAGDILPLCLLKKQKDFFDFVADNFRATYWIPGNHEYYNYNITTVKNDFCEAVRKNVFLLNNRKIEYKNVELVFSTLWSRISAYNEWSVEKNMSDFAVIKNGDRRFNARDMNALHESCLSFLHASFNKKDEHKQTVIVTHHVPTLLHYPEKYKTDSLNEAFASEQHDFIFNSNVDYWIYGHHHVNTPAFTIGKTKMLTNQLGYVQLNEHTTFKSDAIIDMSN